MGKRESFWFLTDLPVGRGNVQVLVQCGRLRWKIENEGFNTQKKQGYHLEHQYSRDYQALKNHYYLIQIGHMIAQVMEAWEMLWKLLKVESPAFIGKVKKGTLQNQINFIPGFFGVIKYFLT